MATLIENLWKVNIETFACCENLDASGMAQVVICFESARKFLRLFACSEKEYFSYWFDDGVHVIAVSFPQNLIGRISEITRKNLPLCEARKKHKLRPFNRFLEKKPKKVGLCQA